MKILGVDWGKKRIGLAISESGVLGRELPEIANDLNELVDFIKKQNITYVVIGLPTTPGGGEGVQAAQIRSFGAKLQQAIAVPISFEDESFTSSEAQSLGGSHSLAARLILEQYLNKISNS